jgi:hypothetical protein
MALARDLPAKWNAPGTDARTKQRITLIRIREVVLDRDDATNEEALVTIHWDGGRHTVWRVRTGRYTGDRYPNPLEVIRKLGGSSHPGRPPAARSKLRPSRQASAESPRSPQVLQAPSGG